MKKLSGGIGGYLYQKTKEHPAKRFALYWDIPSFLLIYAYNDIFYHQQSTVEALKRMNASLSLVEKEVTADKFKNFIQASNKFRLWQEKALQRQSTLTLGKESAKDAKKRTKSHRQVE